MQTKDCNYQIELKAVNDAGEFEGYAAIYDSVDDGNDSISRGAFAKTLAEGSGNLPLLWAHNQAEPIGRVQLRDSPKGLAATGRLALSVSKAQEVYTLMKEGIVKGLSIGFKTVKEEYVGTVRRLKEIRLYEISVVTLPMQPEAQIVSVKAQKSGPDMTEALEMFRNAARDLKDFHRRMIEGD